MHRFKIGIWVALSAAVVFTARPALAATSWSIVPAPPTGQNAVLSGVSAVSASGAWAVGSENAELNGVGAKPVIDSWNGAAWSQVSTPATAGNTANLAAVSASSPTDAWAVGNTAVNRSDIAGLTMHWNGKAWTTVPAVDYGVENSLLSVADISPTDAYAVGDSSASAQGFIEQWNGTSWSLLTLPDPNNGMNTYLDAVSAPSASDVWAVGIELTGTTAANERYQTYSLHWNGSTWAIVPMPLLTGSNNLLQYQFNSIDALSPTNVWAVGDSGNSVGEGGTPTATVIEHYNGTSWSVVPSPSAGNAPTLTGVSAISTSNVWAVGYDTPAGATTPQTLTLNWNGSAWSTVSSPDAGTSSALDAVSAILGGGAWAVGYSGVAGSRNPLVLQNG
ncbi:MAG: hypothetical protein ABSA02_22635 [Trebonia sp.]|jgi:hypothetical protein